MSITEIHQKSFYCYITLAKQKYFIFSRILDYLFSGSWSSEHYLAGVSYQGVGRRSNHIGWFISQAMLLLQQCIFQINHHRTSKALKLDCCLPFSFGSFQSTFQFQEQQSQGRSYLVGTSSTFFCQLFGYYLAQQYLTTSLQRTIIGLSLLLDHLTNNSIICCPFSNIDESLVMRDVQLGSASLVICLILLEHLHICTHFRKNLLYQISI